MTPALPPMSPLMRSLSILVAQKIWRRWGVLNWDPGPDGLLIVLITGCFGRVILALTRRSQRVGAGNNLACFYKSKYRALYIMWLLLLHGNWCSLHYYNYCCSTDLLDRPRYLYKIGSFFGWFCFIFGHFRLFSMFEVYLNSFRPILVTPQAFLVIEYYIL